MEWVVLSLLVFWVLLITFSGCTAVARSWKVKNLRLLTPTLMLLVADLLGLIGINWFIVYSNLWISNGILIFIALIFFTLYLQVILSAIYHSIGEYVSNKRIGSNA